MQNFALYALTVLIWGSTWFVITFQLGEVSPLLSVSYRFALASVLLFGFTLLRGRKDRLKFTRQQHLFIALQGFLLFALNYWIFYFATGYLTSGLVALCFSTMTVMNVFNQALIFRIKINLQVVIGSLFGLAGITLAFWHDISAISLQDSIFIGLALSMIATYAASLGNMAALRNSRNEMPILETNAFGMAYGAALSFILALAIGTPIRFELSPDYIFSLLYLAAFGSAIAFGAYLTLMKRIGADKVAYVTVLFPIVALIVSTIFEGYVWSAESFAGVGLILVGNVIAMTNRKRFQRRQPHAA